MTAPSDTGLAHLSLIYGPGHTMRKINIVGFEMDLLWMWILVAVIVVTLVIVLIICCCAGSDKKEEEPKKEEDMMMEDDMEAMMMEGDKME